LDLVVEFDCCIGWVNIGCCLICEWVVWCCVFMFWVVCEYVCVVWVLCEFLVISEGFVWGEFSYLKVWVLMWVVDEFSEIDLIEFVCYVIVV